MPTKCAVLQTGHFCPVSVLVFHTIFLFELSARTGETDKRTDGRARLVMRPIETAAYGFLPNHKPLTDCFSRTPVRCGVVRLTASWQCNVMLLDSAERRALGPASAAAGATMQWFMPDNP